jgi:hypothetical protein
MKRELAVLLILAFATASVSVFADGEPNTVIPLGPLSSIAFNIQARVGKR